MKQFALLLIALCTITISSCRKDLDTKCKSYTRVNVFNVIGQNEFHLDSTYTNGAGEAYNAYMLKYYISHMKLVNENGERVELYEHELIDHSVPTSLQLDQVEIPDGHYTSLEFNLGVDSLHNHSGDQAGDLDPMYGMIWTWNTGYIFFKHEGYFTSSTSGTQQPLIYHYGTDRALAPISLPIQLHVEGNKSIIQLQFDLNKLYSNPNTIAFTGNNNHQSLSAGDIPWINELRANFPNAFSVNSFLFSE
ncbi:MAG: hypothetical protein NWQ44_01685 [Flavobacteriales bacterium]|nr:hypothetical protein [Flavobacteriales bacterium]MDP4730536.1 hypothetical protein [Flavobacteriales bacterium]MDP4819106.1 hypothetical protein [Flavobacteriales bacterium]MDP4950415.1 hypothetical protein [Flavobacteriales bacterium]MDP5074934.1 hypothetical protein [Flavobacteriales bacterium]